MVNLHMYWFFTRWRNYILLAILKSKKLFYETDKYLIRCLQFFCGNLGLLYMCMYSLKNDLKITGDKKTCGDSEL
jgi:hypothetical protein